MKKNQVTQEKHETVVWVRRDKMRPSALQPRQVFDQAKIDVLAERIRGAQGVVHPLLGRMAADGMVEILDGERRWRAAAAREGMAEVELLPVIIREMGDVEAMEVMLQTVMQREDLSDIEESDAFARALSTLVDGKPAHTVESLAQVIGRGRDYVAQRLALQRLPREGRAALLDGRVSFAVMRLVCAQPMAIFERVLDVVVHPKKFPWVRPGVEPGTGLSEDDVRMLVESLARNLYKAPFDTERSDLVPEKVGADGMRVEGGSCVGCVHNSATGSSAQGSGKWERARCLNPACYDKKKEMNVAAALVAAQEKGVTVLRGADAKRVLSGGPNGTMSPEYVDLKKRLDVDERARSVDERKAPQWREMVEGKEGPIVPVMLAVDEESGRVVEVVEREVAEVAAEKLGKGHLLASGRGKSLQVRDARREEEDRHAEELRAMEIRRAESSAVMSELVKGASGVLWVEPCLLRTFMRLAGDAGCRWVARRYALRGETMEEIYGEFAKAERKDLDGLCLELMLARDLAERDTPQGRSEWPAHVVELARGLALDVEAVCARVRAEQEGKGKAPMVELAWAGMSKGQRNKARNFDVSLSEPQRAGLRWRFEGRRCVGFVDGAAAEGSRKDAETQSTAEAEVGA